MSINASAEEERAVSARLSRSAGEGKGEGDGQWTEAEWPAADVIIGNPPFLGGKRLRDGLGDDMVERLFRTYRGRVPAEADFVCYWVAKAWEQIGAGRTLRAGLVTTNSIRGGANRRVLDPIADSEALMEAWADEPWVLEGAAVRVSMIGFGAGFVERRVEGAPAAAINADLTSAAVDLTKAARLKENAGVAFQGVKFGGPFEVSDTEADYLLSRPHNPNGRSNRDVLRPWFTGLDIIRRPVPKWVIDFSSIESEEGAALFELPYERAKAAWAEENARRASKKPPQPPLREGEAHVPWWAHQRPRPELRDAIRYLGRYIATNEVAKYRVFVFRVTAIIPVGSVYVIARDDDTTFGILHSRFHELWSLRMGTWLGVGNDPRYTPSTTFETFPFPEGLTPNIPAADYADDPRAQAIAAAAADLNAKREAWLNPPDLVRIEPEVVPGYPDRILPKDEAAAKELKKRTLTNLYNQRPAWLDMAHRRLDEAVAAAYGWPTDLPDDDILARLFALNQERAAAGR